MLRFPTALPFIALACCVLGPADAYAVDTGDVYPRVAAYELDAAFFPDRAAIEATAQVRFAPYAEFGEQLVFHLHGELRVDSLRVDGAPTKFRQEKVLFRFDYSNVATRIEVDLDGPVRDGVTIVYSGWLNPSRAGARSNYMRVDDDGVLLRSYGYSLWFPVFLPDRSDDYPVDFTRVTIDVPVELRPVFVGEQIGEQIVASGDGDRRIAEWRALGTDVFDAQCTARRFGVGADGPNRVYHERDETSAAMGRQILGLVGDLAAAFVRDYGEAGGGGGVHVMQMPEFGDIASGNVIGVSEKNWQTFDQDVWGQRTVAHELVHAFVRTPVRRDDPLYALAIEGFPSYFHLPVLGELLGPEVYTEWMQRTEDAYLRRRETGLGWRDRPLPPEKPLLELTADDISEYKDAFVLNDRARLFLNWVRTRLGVAGFRTFTRELFSQQQLDALAFEGLLLRHLGDDAAADIQVWLHTTDYPQRIKLLPQ